MFTPSHYPLIFADKDVRDAFNRGLKRLRESGQYEAIIAKYSHLTNLYNISDGSDRIPPQ